MESLNTMNIPANPIQSNKRANRVERIMASTAFNSGNSLSSRPSLTITELNRRIGKKQRKGQPLTTDEKVAHRFYTWQEISKTINQIQQFASVIKFLRDNFGSTDSDKKGEQQFLKLMDEVLPKLYSIQLEVDQSDDHISDQIQVRNALIEIENLFNELDLNFEPSRYINKAQTM